VAGATGGYYVKSQRREPSPAARDAAAARRLWQLSEELTGLKTGFTGTADDSWGRP
jgi:hypothetical protein